MRDAFYIMPIHGRPNTVTPSAAHRRWKALTPMAQGFIEAMYTQWRGVAFPDDLGFNALTEAHLKLIEDTVAEFSNRRPWIEAYGDLADNWTHVRSIEWMGGWRFWQARHGLQPDDVFPNTEWLSYTREVGWATALTRDARRFTPLRLAYSGFTQRLEVLE